MAGQVIPATPSSRTSPSSIKCTMGRTAAQMHAGNTACGGWGTWWFGVCSVVCSSSGGKDKILMQQQFAVQILFDKTIYNIAKIKSVTSGRVPSATKQQNQPSSPALSLTLYRRGREAQAEWERELVHSTKSEKTKF